MKMISMIKNLSPSVFGCVCLLTAQLLVSPALAEPSSVQAEPTMSEAAPDGTAAMQPEAMQPVETISADDATDTQSIDAIDQAATAASSAAQMTEVKNPYGFEALWGQGDYIARGTLIIMMIMSLVTWYTLITKLWEQQRFMSHGTAASKLWAANNIQEGVAQLPPANVFRNIAEVGINARKQYDARTGEKMALQDWLTLSIQRAAESINADLQSGLAFLATVGSTAPFVGLFGTVWGIYHALISIGIAGQASIDKVAGPVGEALIMTAIGLAVAVPAVLGYNWLVRRNKVVMEDLRAFSNDINSTLLMGVRLSTQGV